MVTMAGCVISFFPPSSSPNFLRKEHTKSYWFSEKECNFWPPCQKIPGNHEEIWTNSRPMVWMVIWCPENIVPLPNLPDSVRKFVGTFATVPWVLLEMMKSRGKTAWIPFYVERGSVFPSDDLMLTVKLKLEEIKKSREKSWYNEGILWNAIHWFRPCLNDSKLEFEWRWKESEFWSFQYKSDY